MDGSNRGVFSSSGPVGVVDIGSNSVRLVIYERLARSPTRFFNEKVLLGLGRRVAEQGFLDEKALLESEATLRRFRALADQTGVQDLVVLATAAIREAENGADFIEMAEAACRSEVRILTGEEEAHYAGLGILSGIPDADGVCGDLGGGSLELVNISQGNISHGETFPLGGLRLQHASGKNLKEARRIAVSHLQRSQLLPALAERSFYAIGGTWRSLARLHMRNVGYPLDVMQQYRIEAGEMSNFLKKVLRSDIGSIEGIESVSRQRQALVPYGAAVLSALIKIGNPKWVMTSALGLREGVLYSKLDPAERAEDPLISAAAELAELRSRSLVHARELIVWSTEAMQAIGIEETTEEKRLRAAACLLADIGWRAHPDYRGQQSLNIIANAAFVGIDHPGRAYLAMAVYYRHSGLSEADLAPAIRDLATPRLQELAKLLAGIFRVGYLVSASMPGIIPRTAIGRSGKILQLRLPTDLAMLAGGRLEARLRQLGNLCGLNSEIRIGEN